MEKETIKENIEKISGIETMLKEVKALFSTEKKEEVKAEVTPVVAESEPVAEVKVEFNHEEFTKNFNDFKSSIEAQATSYNEKFVAFEAQITEANAVIAKQGEQLTKMFSLVEKALSTPVVASTQKKKEGIKTNGTPFTTKEELEAFRNLK